MKQNYEGKRKNSGNRRKLKNKAAILGIWAFAAMMVPCRSLAGTGGESMLVRSAGNAVETPFNATLLAGLRSVGTGDLWADWVGDLSFLSGEKGKGTREEPYQISTKAQLMGLSELASMDMQIGEGEGTYPGDYTGAYFMLTKNIDLGGIDWMPIGFYQNQEELLTGTIHSFCGHFDGNGKTVSNFRLYAPEWNQAGFFGAINQTEITGLTIRPGYVITAGEDVGILAGSASESVIRDVTVSGTLKTSGNAGGIVGNVSENTILENCTADHTAIDTGTKKETFAGGIAGKASESLILDCRVNTGDSITARISGGGYIGGIVGFQNSTDLFNVYVMGTVGGNGSQSIGGVTGKYASGKMKVARFEGKIASSGLGSAAREGTFIGTHDTGFHFRYGTETGADLAYLFADTEEKIAAGVCGSGIPDDNAFGYGAHIGFWHGKDNFYTLVQGQNTKPVTEVYFYEELEEGVLHVIDTEDFVRDGNAAPDHFAPNQVGRPARGYLVSVLQIDTEANAENYYDVAALTARGESAYSKELNKLSRGAVAAGDVVTVTTAPRNTEDEKYQMEGVPTYTNTDGKRIDTAYQTGGTFTFVMPEHDTEVSAVYKKVAADIRIVPETFSFRVIQTRTGDRKNPSVVTEVRDGAGKLIAKYLDGTLEENTTVQEVNIGAVVDRNNDVADSRVQWSVDNSDLLILKQNKDEDSEGYTALSASIALNLDAEFFRTVIAEAEKAQAESGYRYPIPDTVYGNGTKGGLAVLTARTKPAASFEGKPAVANCKIPVIFQMKDQTNAALEKVSFDKAELTFTVTRKLSGSRRNPKEEITVSGPQKLTALFTPDFFPKKTVSWSVKDPRAVTVDQTGSGEAAETDAEAFVEAVKDAAWIQELIDADEAACAGKFNAKRNASGTRETEVSVTAEDVLGNRRTAVCSVKINFLTEDKTALSSGGSSSGGSSFGGSTGGSLKGSMGVSGEWKKNTDGTWSYMENGKNIAGRWAYIFNPYAKAGQETVSWFLFDNAGIMKTGWYQEPGSGSWFYLHNVPDGNQGSMYTGWHQIGGIWYYFGLDGRLYQNTMTPDGYSVGTDGAWIRQNH